MPGDGSATMRGVDGAPPSSAGVGGTAGSAGSVNTGNGDGAQPSSSGVGGTTGTAPEGVVPQQVTSVPNTGDGAVPAAGTSPGSVMGSSGPYRLTVTRVGPEGGRVTSSVPGIDCGSACTALFSGPVALSARTDNGGGALFNGWSESVPESACTGFQRSCSILMDHDQAVTANFAALDHNLVFVSSKAYPATLGGVSAYNVECNALASAAGINDAAGSGYLAMMSDFGDEASPSGDLLDRIGSARGWVRLDGLPVADAATDLIGPTPYYPPVFTEQGVSPGFMGGGTLAWTGLGIDANGNDHCVRWTQASPNSVATSGTSNALRWSGEAVTPCDNLLPIYCIGTTRTQPLQSVPVYTGKRLWVTSTRYTPGTSTPDQQCQSDRPAGVARGVAYIAYSDRPASAVLDPAALYVLSDGRAVGTGAQLIAGQLLVGPWLLADGTPVPAFDSVWVGAERARSSAGSLYTTCQDWTSNDAGLSGSAESTGYPQLGSFGNTFPCSNASHLYCVEP